MITSYIIQLCLLGAYSTDPYLQVCSISEIASLQTSKKSLAAARKKVSERLNKIQSVIQALTQVTHVIQAFTQVTHVIQALTQATHVIQALT